MPEIRTGKPTLKDIARLAGVSVGTASTAFSHPEKLKKETLERIMQVVQSLGYIRNGAAQALVSQKTSTIAVTVPTIDNPLYSSLVASIQKVLVANGYHMVIGSHEYQFEREYEVIRFLIEKGIDGLVVVGAMHEERTFTMLKMSNIPYVISLSLSDRPQQHSVGISNYDAGYAVGSLVASMGHKAVALSGGFHASNERALEREQGALAALRKHGLEVPQEWRIQHEISISGGRDIFRKLWSLDAKPSALICSTDVQAIGVLDEARRYGVDVPGTLSVTGFDDIEYASLCTPPLTTVKMPTVEIGTRSTKHLLEMIQGKNPMRLEKLDTSIILRESLANAK